MECFVVLYKTLRREIESIRIKTSKLDSKNCVNDVKLKKLEINLHFSS